MADLQFLFPGNLTPLNLDDDMLGPFQIGAHGAFAQIQGRKPEVHLARRTDPIAERFDPFSSDIALFSKLTRDDEVVP